MQEWFKGILMTGFAGGIALTLAAVDKDVLPTLDGSDSGDTSVTNPPPGKVEGGAPPRPGMPPKEPPEAPGEKPEGPGVPGNEPEPEKPDPETEPEALPPEPETDPEGEEPASLPPPPDPEKMPPPEPGEEAGEPDPGREGLPGTDEPYIPSEKLGADAAVDFPVDI